MLYVHKVTGEQYDDDGIDWVRGDFSERRRRVHNLRLNRSVWVLESNLDPDLTANAAPADPIEALDEREGTHYYGDGHDHSVDEGVDLEERPTDWGDLDGTTGLDAAPGVSAWAEQESKRERQVMDAAFFLAGEQTFHVGNAILNLAHGDLNGAREAIEFEIARQYRVPVVPDHEEK